MSTVEGRAAARVQPHFWLGTGIIVLCAVSFAFITTFARLAYDDGTTPLTLVFLRFGSFVVVIGGLRLLRRRSFALPGRAVAASAGLAVCILAMSVGYLSSVKYIPVGLAAIILYTFPLMVGILSSLTGREPMTAVKAIALIGAFAGLALALGPRFANLDPRGVGWALTAAVGVAVALVYGGPLMREHDAMLLNIYINVWMLIAVGLYLLWAGGLVRPASLAGALGAAGATACYIVGFICMFAALRFIAPMHSALMLNAEPLVSILAAMLILGERLAPVQAAGVAVVLAALVAMTFGGRTRPAE